ncbi:MAG: hypothetical protein CMI63_08425 [Parvularcula sp.]|nr:hypothetical protein [Parvularcula sp.]
MDPDLYLSAVFYGVLFRYNLAMTSACRFVGQKLGDADGLQVVQDAITPKWHTLLTVAVFFATFASAIFGFMSGGFLGLGLFVFIWSLSSLLIGLLLFKRVDSAHFLSKIYRSMVRRKASYERKKDNARARLMSELITKFKFEFGSPETAQN